MDQRKMQSSGEAQGQGQETRVANERRRALISGLAKGGAVVATVAPIKSYATGRIITGNNTLCSQSGQMSNIMSRTGASVECSGKPPSHYQKKKNWPQGYKDSYDTLTFKQLFTASTNQSLCKAILNQSPTSNEAYWIAAFFNAAPGGGGNNFPYRPVSTSNEPTVVSHYEAWLMHQRVAGVDYLNLYKKHLSGG